MIQFLVQFFKVKLNKHNQFLYSTDGKETQEYRVNSIYYIYKNNDI